MLLPSPIGFRADGAELTSPEQQHRLEGILDCRSLRGVSECSRCPVFDECVQVKEYLARYAACSRPTSGSGGDP